jgi:hypothetical protein
LSTDLLAEQSDLRVEAITLGGEADAMDGAVDGKTAHMGEHEVGEGRTWSVAVLACLGQALGNRRENGEVGMVGGQSMGQLLSKDSGAREWKHASRSAAATP